MENITPSSLLDAYPVAFSNLQDATYFLDENQAELTTAAWMRIADLLDPHFGPSTSGMIRGDMAHV